MGKAKGAQSVPLSSAQSVPLSSAFKKIYKVGNKSISWAKEEWHGKHVLVALDSSRALHWKNA